MSDLLSQMGAIDTEIRIVRRDYSLTEDERATKIQALQEKKDVLKRQTRIEIEKIWAGVADKVVPQYNRK